MRDPGSSRRPPTRPTLLVRLGAVLCAAAVTWPALRAADAPGLSRSTPEQQGVSSAALLDFVTTADREIDAMHSVMILRHGHVIAEGWWAPYAPNVPHTLYSLTKSFTSTAIGIAVGEGRLSIDDPVLKFFPEDAPVELDKNLKALRIRDLLSMSTGHHEEPPTALRNPSAAEATTWTKAFLSTPVVHKPGTFFLYNTPASNMLSAILQKVTGEKTEQYLRPRLFEPLGITDLRWETSPQGVTIGGYGLHLRTESVARFGQMYLQKGVWQGKQVVPAAWVEAATARQVSNGSDPASDWDQGYGYQFWRSRHGAYRGDGAFGQYCLVLPEQDALVVITSGVKNMQATLDLVFSKLLPAFGPGPLPPNPGAEAALRKALAGLSLHPVQGGAQPGAGVTLRRRFAFPENAEKVEWIALERGGDGVPVLVTRVAGVERRVPAPNGRWATLRLPERLPILEQSVAASGAWTGERTFAATVAYYETPFKMNVTLTFDGDTVTYGREMHVAFGETKLPTLTGRVQ